MINFSLQEKGTGYFFISFSLFIIPLNKVACPLFPFPCGMYRVTEGVKSSGSYEPIVVFEARLGTDHFVQLGKHDASAEARSAQFKRLEAAQKLK